jgi:hypothetical protein
VNIRPFPAFLQDSRKARTATSASPEPGIGYDHGAIKRRSKSSLSVPSFDSPAGYAMTASRDPE